MNSKVYKWCAVPQCKNTSIKTPHKLFVHVPAKKIIRDKWFNLARRDPNDVLENTPIYFCEDHFDLPNDMENYMQYHVMGSVAQVRMKPGCMPQKFQCQPDRKTSTERAYLSKERSKSRANYMRDYRQKKRDAKIKTGKLEPKKIPANSTQRSRDWRARHRRITEKLPLTTASHRNSTSSTESDETNPLKLLFFRHTIDQECQVDFYSDSDVDSLTFICNRYITDAICHVQTQTEILQNSRLRRKMPNDMENYMQYHVTGSVAKIRMKPDCLPSKFHCQKERNDTQSPTNDSNTQGIFFIDNDLKTESQLITAQNNIGIYEITLPSSNIMQEKEHFTFSDVKIKSENSPELHEELVLKNEPPNSLENKFPDEDPSMVDAFRKNIKTESIKIKDEPPEELITANAIKDEPMDDPSD